MPLLMRKIVRPALPAIVLFYRVPGQAERYPPPLRAAIEGRTPEADRRRAIPSALSQVIALRDWTDVQ